MKSNRLYFKIVISATLIIGCSMAQAVDEVYDAGAVAAIDYQVDGHVWIEDATVTMYEPAHIMGAVITGSGAVFDVYGGQIDFMLLVSTSGNELPDADVTIYATDFMVDGVPVDPGTTELHLVGQTLSGLYVDGNYFQYVVDCAISGSAGNIYYQTVKLGWLVSEPAIEVSENEYDVGAVDIGDRQPGIVTVYNLGTANLTLQSLAMDQDENLQFDFMPLLQLPMTIEPDSAIDLEVVYAPTVEGPAEAIFQIASDDPNNPVMEVVLAGEGVPVLLTPEEQIAVIIDNFDQAVQDGTIVGTGKKKAATARVRVIRKTLVILQRSIEAGSKKSTTKVLGMLQKKTDGKKRPTDFVEGDGAVILNSQITELKNELDEAAKKVKKKSRKKK